MSDAIVTLTLQDRTYNLRRRLSWRAQANIDSSAFRIFVDGKELSDKQDLSKIDKLEIQMDNERQTALRLKARLVDERGQTLKNAEIDDIPGPHVAVIVSRIEKLESEEEEEVRLLSEPDSPLEERSSE